MAVKGNSYLVIDLEVKGKSVPMPYSGECGVYEGSTPEEALTAALDEWGWSPDDGADHFTVILLSTLEIYRAEPRASYTISKVGSHD